MIKQVRVCDSCGTTLEKGSETYHLNFVSSRFCDAAGSRDYNAIRLDLCKCCCESAIESLKRIEGYMLQRKDDFNADARQNTPLTGPLKIGDTVHGMKIVGLDASAGTITLGGWNCNSK